VKKLVVDAQEHHHVVHSIKYSHAHNAKLGQGPDLAKLGSDVSVFALDAFHLFMQLSENCGANV
jgi:hypothetical protein